jgi:hypothetical protein
MRGRISWVAEDIQSCLKLESVVVLAQSLIFRMQTRRKHQLINFYANDVAATSIGIDN